MPIVNRIADFAAEMTAWRQDFHAHPELGFEERRTSDIVAAKLAEWGIEVTRGIATTGAGRHAAQRQQRAGSIGLRADMDCLPMTEQTGLPHASTVPGKMHACGHDGHTATLLGAAKYLAETKNFDGTVHFIFQPAEEGGGGGKVMVDEGLFERFPCDTVFGIHNDPTLPLGEARVVPGRDPRGLRPRVHHDPRHRRPCGAAACHHRPGAGRRACAGRRCRRWWRGGPTRWTPRCSASRCSMPAAP